MYTYQQRLEYAKRIQQIQKFMVVKDNIHLTYKYKNRNKAIKQAHNIQDEIITSIVDDAIHGNVDNVKGIDSKVEELLGNTLQNERKRIHNNPDKYVERAVELNTQKYSEILTNRINTESIKLQTKIESELRSRIHNDLNEKQIREELLKKYGETGKARIKNIIKDSIHTNESNISFINALSEGYSYKVWMNGRGKGKTRAWHKAKYISSVPIEDYFDIYGPYGHKELMYPGDLYGGAENVANCRCWLRYTNNTPENLKQKTKFNVSPTFQQIWDKATNKTPLNIVKKPIQKVTTKVKKIGNKITSKIKTPKISSKKHDPRGIEKNIPKSYKQFKGNTPNGMLPNNEKISDYFSKDISKTSKFDKLIDRWANSPLDKKLRILSNCNFNYKKLEKYLIKDKKLPNYLIPTLKKEAIMTLQEMEAIMKNSHTKKDMVFHRQQNDLHLGNNPKIGKVIEWDSYNSVSISKEGLEYFQDKYKKQKWEFTILAPKGTRGVYISPKSGKKYAPEMEFILDRHTKLKIIDIDYEFHKVVVKVIV